MHIKTPSLPSITAEFGTFHEDDGYDDYHERQPRK